MSNNKSKNIIYIVITFVLVGLSLLGLKGPLKTAHINIESSKIHFILDVSKSMNVKDILINSVAQSRLLASKNFISYYLDNKDYSSYALSIFAGETLEVLPFTSNNALFKTILSGVDDRNVSKYGSSFQAIFNLIDSYSENVKDSASTVVIFTDGGDQIDISTSYLSIDTIKDMNIILVGVGTKRGGYIEEGTNPFGDTVYKLYNGERVVSKLNSSELLDMSDKFDFIYSELSSEDDYLNLVKNINKLLTKSQGEISSSNRIDLSYYLLIIAFLSFNIYLIGERYSKRS